MLGQPIMVLGGGHLQYFAADASDDMLLEAMS
jgi:hypothetical protein